MSILTLTSFSRTKFAAPSFWLPDKKYNQDSYWWMEVEDDEENEMQRDGESFHNQIFVTCEWVD